MKQLILASQSPYRRQLLERLNVAFIQCSPRLDESAIQAGSLLPQQKAELLAVLKAEQVLVQYPNAIVIGGDQIAALGEKILVKPGSPDNALAQLQLMSGKSHYLYTAIAVLSADKREVFTNVAKLTMKSHSVAELERYIACDKPYDCAGSYKYERNGHRLFEAVECDDETAIQGIPLKRLAQVLGLSGHH